MGTGVVEEVVLAKPWLNAGDGAIAVATGIVEEVVLAKRWLDVGIGAIVVNTGIVEEVVVVAELGAEINQISLLTLCTA